jgi:hypothetical protein
MPVEALRAGAAMLLTSGDDSQPIVWVGHREVDRRHHPRPATVCPVRLGAGAFASGVPQRDLYLSPDHAAFAGEVLIPVKYLVNGRTITEIAVFANHGVVESDPTWAWESEGCAPPVVTGPRLAATRARLAGPTAAYVRQPLAEMRIANRRA